MIRTKYELKNKKNKDFVRDEEALEYSNEKDDYFCHITVFWKIWNRVLRIF